MATTSILASNDEMLSAIKDILADKLIACNCGGPCEGNCTYARLKGIIAGSAQSDPNRKSHALQPTMRYHIVPVMVAVPYTMNGILVDAQGIYDAIGNALLPIVRNGEQTGVHDFAICMEESKGLEEGTGPQPNDGDAFKRFRISLDDEE